MAASAWVRSLACTFAVLAPLALAQTPSLALPPAGATPRPTTGDSRR